MHAVWELPPPDSDDWAAERWTNKIHLDSPRAVSDPAWRRELVSWGLAVAEPLVEQAASLTDLPVQATVALQSAPGKADPDADYATGAIHVYCCADPAQLAATRVGVETSTGSTPVGNSPAGRQLTSKSALIPSQCGADSTQMKS